MQLSCHYFCKTAQGDVFFVAIGHSLEAKVQLGCDENICAFREKNDFRKMQCCTTNDCSFFRPGHFRLWLARGEEAYKAPSFS